MKMTPIGLDLWDCIESNNTNVLDPKRNQRALAAICSKAKSQCHMHLSNVENAKEVWIKLRKVYEDTGLSRIVILMQSLFKIDYNDYHDMHKYVSEALSLSQKLADIGNPVEDKLLTVILLAGLPVEYKPMVMAQKFGNL
ncbi:hypothetical protein WN48_09710 [Eufriesea mexicana]|uniref:Retrovirus-related Pol polyprotein from transposon TNT 1-94 n=1 Tax=Eufriesea mexicana TaxID=516756 RepID=A0A310SHB2_9HYME|nr:hypothetical protein WN48_09710 [Eufriesea mexicana]